MTAPLAFLDTETDGIHPDRKAWEVAIIRREPDGTETEWQAFIEIDLATADPFGLRVGRFYDRHPLGRLLSGKNGLPLGVSAWSDREVMPLDQAAVAIARFTHGAHIVGAVPNFDTEVLDKLLRHQAILPAWHYHLIDIENLAVGYLAAQGTPLAPPWNSNTLTEALGIPLSPEEDRHTAMGDVRWAKNVYDAILTTKALAE